MEHATIVNARVLMAGFYAGKTVAAIGVIVSKGVWHSMKGVLGERPQVYEPGRIATSIKDFDHWTKLLLTLQHGEIVVWIVFSDAMASN